MGHIDQDVVVVESQVPKRFISDKADPLEAGVIVELDEDWLGEPLFFPHYGLHQVLHGSVDGVQEGGLIEKLLEEPGEGTRNKSTSYVTDEGK